MLWQKGQFNTAVLLVYLILKPVLTEKLLPTVTKPVLVIGCEM